MQTIAIEMGQHLHNYDVAIVILLLHIVLLIRMY